MESPYTLDRLKDGFTKNGSMYKDYRVLFDGVFKGDYSLAIVNRQLARALINTKMQLDLFSPESDLDNDPLLNAMPDVCERILSQIPAHEYYDVHLRNTWPPRADDMVGKFNAYVCFAWEEMEFPQKWVDEFNQHLDAVMVTANYVRQSFLHSGITIPVYVVGNGSDHLLTLKDKSTKQITTEIQTFLHVSSCFPRKGVDLLIEAFSRTFQAEEKIELCIKTFSNPHNTVAHDIAQARKRYPHAAPIRLIEESLPDAEVRALYKSAVALVAPSRGEGFGLPLAEAILLDVPIITTAYGGQTDFCTVDTALLIDYKLVPSQAHVAGALSVWAEPSIESIGEKMRAVLEQPMAARTRTNRAKKLLNMHFTWAAVAQRVIVALNLEIQPKRVVDKKMTNTQIDIVSTWEQQCGIATYCESLMGTAVFSGNLGRIFARSYNAADNISAAVNSTLAVQELTRPWGYDFAGIQRLGKALVDAVNPVVWFQHHPGFFSAQDMRYLCTQLAKSRYQTKVITLHNVKDILYSELDWLNTFDVVFVHTATDACLLSGNGLREPVVLPHGIQKITSERKMVAPKDSFTVGSFGFLYPHKNIPMLVQAIAFARYFSCRIRLRLLNCVKADDASRLEKARVLTLIEALNASDYIEFDDRFLAESEVIKRLAECDLIAFPYAESPESATGAARVALAANKPLLISQSKVLSDLHDYAHCLHHVNTATLAECILSLAANPQLLHLYDAERYKFTQYFSYDNVAIRYAANIEMALERHI